MTQAIVTKYHGPNRVQGSRVSCTAASGRMYFPWDNLHGIAETHRLAALRYCQEKGWTGRYVGGCLPSGDYVWVFDGPQGDGEFETVPGIPRAKPPSFASLLAANEPVKTWPDADKRRAANWRECPNNNCQVDRFCLGQTPCAEKRP